MIKLVKNEFFIYCKETRIESNRSFYGSFSLGPFDSGQSITIANALRRTLLSELKGLAITSAEIEGALHEYSTLPGVKDSILDILLNLKDIVLKTENYGNKKRGTSSYYATTFKKTQIGYLKTRGPGIVTASELKLPPGIQCVDPDQYIATLSEEGILNIKLMINEGKNYVLQNFYPQNNNSNLSHSEKSRAEKKEPLFGKEPSRQKAQAASLPGPLKKAKAKAKAKAQPVNNKKKIQQPSDLFLLPGLENSGYKARKGLRTFPTADFTTYIKFKRRRLWLHKRNLFQIPSLFLGNRAIPKNLSSNKPVKPAKITKFLGLKIRSILPEKSPRKESFLFKQKDVKPGFLLPVLNMIKKIRSRRKTTQSLTNSVLLPQKILATSFSVKNNLFRFLLIKKSSRLRRAGVKGFFENTQKYKNNSPNFAPGAKSLSFSSSRDFSNLGELRFSEGDAITATKSVSLVIDAVFMPVNKVNYIIETNEQSVMSSEKKSSIMNSTPQTAFGAVKGFPLPIFSPDNFNVVQPNIVENKEKWDQKLAVFWKSPISLSKADLRFPSPEKRGKNALQKGLKRKFLLQNGRVYFSSSSPPKGESGAKKKILPLPFSIYKSKGLLFSLNYLSPNKSQRVSYFVKIGQKVASEGTCSFSSSFFVRNNIIVFQKKKTNIMSQQLRFIKSCLVNFGGKQPFLTYNNKSNSFVKEGDSLREFKRTSVLPTNEEEKEHVFNQVSYPIKNERLLRKKVFLKSVAAQKIKIIGTHLNNGTNTNHLDFSLAQSIHRRRERNSLPNPEKTFFGDKMRLSDIQTKTQLKNNIILEIWTNGSIHPRQALYEACKNLLSLFSKLEKATPLAFPQRTLNLL